MSEDLFVDGKQFISVKRASQKTGYTRDYVGQLCRQGKLPARMIGGAWYIEFGATTAYKESTDQKNKTKEVISVANTEVLGITRPNLDRQNFKYESEKLSALPKISKPEPSASKSLTSWNPAHSLGSYATLMAILFIVLNASASWVEFASPGKIALINSEIISASKLFGNELSNFGQGFSLALAQDATTAPTATTTADGVVIFPDSADHEAKVNTIKNNFSDDVSVIFDEGGSSGVIQPIFVNGDAQNYAFVMVPVKNKK